MQRAQQRERIDDRLQIRRDLVPRQPIRMEPPESLAILDQLLVADREERALERRVHRELVVGPLHRRQRGAQALDFFAQVERAAADQQVRDPARLQRLDIRARDVRAERRETAEEQAHVARRDRHRLAGPLALGHLPATVLHQPRDECADGLGQRLLHGFARESLPAVRLRHGQRNDSRLARDLRAVARQRHVARLQRVPVVGHHGRERGVDEILDRRDRAKRRRQIDARGTARDEQILHRLVRTDVGAAEAIDRLLGVADEEQLARRRRDVLPAGDRRVRGRQQ